MNCLISRTYVNRLISPLIRFKYTIDYSNVPEVKEADLEEQFVRGSGPGGQSVNKTANAVVLKHIPSGVVVKCHESRSLDQNRKRARVLLQTKLDNFINKENSIEAQEKRLHDKKRDQYEKKQERLREMKKQWKMRNDLQ